MNTRPDSTARHALRGTSLVQRLDAHWAQHPGAALSTREALALFGGTPHALRQAVYRLRRLGTPIRCERVYRLRRGGA